MKTPDKKLISLEAKEYPKVSLEHKFSYLYSILYEGKKIGEVTIPADTEASSYFIGGMEIDEEYRGKGFGVATYKALIEFLDKPIETFGANPEAMHVWESLLKQGLAEKTEYGYRSTTSRIKF